MGLIKVTLRKINNACEDARLRPKAYKGTSSAGERAYAHALFIFLLFFVVGLVSVDRHTLSFDVSPLLMSLTASMAVAMEWSMLL